MATTNVSGPITRMTVITDFSKPQRLPMAPGIASVIGGFRKAADYTASYLKLGFHQINFSPIGKAGIDLDVQEHDHVLIPGSIMMSGKLINAGITGGRIELIPEASALDPEDIRVRASGELFDRFNKLISIPRENLIRLCLWYNDFTLKSAGTVPMDIKQILMGQLVGTGNAQPAFPVADNVYGFYPSVDDIPVEVGMAIAKNSGVSASSLSGLMQHPYFFAEGFPQYRAAFRHEESGFTLAFIGSGPTETQQGALFLNEDAPKLIYPVRTAASEILAAMAASDLASAPHLLLAAHGTPTSRLLSPLSEVSVYSSISDVPDISEWNI